MKDHFEKAHILSWILSKEKKGHWYFFQDQVMLNGMQNDKQYFYYPSISFEMFFEDFVGCITEWHIMIVISLKNELPECVGYTCWIQYKIKSYYKFILTTPV